MINKSLPERCLIHEVYNVISSLVRESSLLMLSNSKDKT